MARFCAFCSDLGRAGDEARLGRISKKVAVLRQPVANATKDARVLEQRIDRCGFSVGCVQMNNPSSRREIRALTGIRGLAAVLVVGYHFLSGPAAQNSRLEHLVLRGYLSVDVFFILSGFVLAMNYASLFKERVKVAVWGDFLARRLARIFPIYLVVLIAQLALVWLYYQGVINKLGLGSPRAPTATEIGANLLLIQSWGIARSLLGQAWSVSTEMAAYLAFPFLVRGLVGSARKWAMLAAISSFSMIFAIAWFNGDGDPWKQRALDLFEATSFLPLLRCFAGFAMGMIIWRLANSLSQRSYAFSDVTGVVILIMIVIIAISPLPDIALYPLFPLLLLCLSGNRGRVAAWFGWEPIYFSGVVSFSLYLLQGFLLSPARIFASRLLPVVGPIWAWSLALIVLLALLLAISALTYVLIEKPGRHLVHRPRAYKPATAPSPAVGV
jgi:peptidoglycan/LPS O-acetylase OafA/YrhL